MSPVPVISIVDSDAVYRSSLALLTSSFGYRVAVYSSANEFLRAFDSQVPGCVIIDVQAPDTSGLALQSVLAARALPPSIIVMTNTAEVSIAVRAMQQGAVDFLQKSCPDSEIASAIERAIQRDRVNRVNHARRISDEERMSLLSPPEREVLDLVLEGKANKNIAAKLGVSPRTVEDRRARIMQKLRVDSVPRLVALAIRAGICVES